MLKCIKEFRIKLAIFLISLVVVMIFVTVWFSHLVGVSVGNGQAFASNMRLLYVGGQRII